MRDIVRAQSVPTGTPAEAEVSSGLVVFDEFGDPLPNPDPSPPYNVYIPPRTHGGKRKKSKNRRRHSETIWTIVSEQENQQPQFTTTPKPDKQKYKSKDKDKEAASRSLFSTPLKDSDKKEKSKKKQSKETDSAVSFLGNPIFETELKNWTLPRAELWCRDPQCQINIQLWNDYYLSHQSELTQLQVQELVNQQHQYAHHQYQHQYAHHQHQHQQCFCEHQPPPPPAPPLPQLRYATRFMSDADLPPDLPAPSSLSRRQRLSTLSQILDNTDGATTNSSQVHSPRSPHPHIAGRSLPLPASRSPYQHQRASVQEEGYYPHQYGNMHLVNNMSIGASINHAHSRQQDSGVETPSSSTSASSKTPIPTALPQSSGGSSAKTVSTTIGSDGSRGKSSSMGDGSGTSQSSGSGESSSSDYYSGTSNTDVTTERKAGYRKTGICPSCHGLVPPPPTTSTNHHLIPVDPILNAAGLGGHTDATLGVLPHHHHHHTTTPHQYHQNITSANANKSDVFWNFSKFQHPLQRDHSFHSVGGFTLNGQYNTQVKKSCIVKFCSSHKIALVVSTFSLLVTIGLVITLLFMKKRGMMDTMDMMPT